MIRLGFASRFRPSGGDDGGATAGDIAGDTGP